MQTFHAVHFLLFFRKTTSNKTGDEKSDTSQTTSNTAKQKKDKRVLDCGKPVNNTQYDHLRGIANRHNHPHIPEPEVALIFRKKGSRNSEVDMNDLERRLRKLKKDVSSFLILTFYVLFLSGSILINIKVIVYQYDQYKTYSGCF